MVRKEVLLAVAQPCPALNEQTVSFFCLPLVVTFTNEHQL